jgi:hypothetical protein
LFKIIAKVLANRLKKVLPSIISQQQSAIVLGRLILDNIMVAYEALHTMYTQMKGKNGFMEIKLDMSKAYDKVKWTFLEEIMRKMRFKDMWIALIMNCVTTISYSILMAFHLVRSLPQEGDTLSPYIFLLCTEGLSSLLLQAAQEGRITGVPIAAKGSWLRHLFFADDSLLFYRATFQEWGNVMQLIQKYELASDWKINNTKTAIFCSRNTRL